MPDKPEESPAAKIATAPKPKRRGWFRRLLKWTGIALLVLALFHRPLFHTVARFALIQIASKQNVKLDVHFSGTIFTNLNVRDISALPNGRGPSPVEKIAIESVQLHYSIISLIKHGLGEFLQSYELKNADLVFKAVPSKNEAEKKQKKSLAEDLNNLLAQPALYADAVNIDHFSIAIHSLDGKTTEVRDLRLFLHPWDPGYLRIERIAVPGLPPWEHIDAVTSYAKRNLFIQHLALSPELVIDEYNFDASQRSQDKGSMLLKASLFGGYLQLGLGGSKLKAKGENLAQSYDTKLAIDASGVDVKAAAQYFGAKEPPVARLGWLKVAFAGEPEKPRTWKGDVAVRAEGFTAGKANIDFADAYLNFSQGVASLYDTELAMGPSTVSLKAAAQLPESVDGFPQTEGDAEIGVDAPDLAALTQAFLPEPIGGAVAGGGKVGLHNHQAIVDFTLNGTKIGTKDYAVGTTTLTLSATKALDQPAGAAPTAGLQSQASVRLGELSYATFTADSLAVDVQTKDDLVTLQGLDLTRAENHVTAKGTYRLPAEKGKPAPIDAEFAITAPTLETFKLGLKEYILSGHLSASGQVHSINNALTGNVQLDGGDFQLGDFKAAKLAAKVGIANDEATIEQFALNINGTDQIATTGKVGLKEPMNFEGAVLVLFKDLAVLQPLLAIFDVKEEVGGALDFSVESQGTLKPLAPTGLLKINVAKAHYAKMLLHEFRLATLFGPDFVESSDFHVALNAASFSAPKKDVPGVTAVPPSEAKPKAASATAGRSIAAKPSATKANATKANATSPTTAKPSTPDPAATKPDSTTLDAKIAWREGKASVKEISLVQGGQQALTGYIIVPLDPKNKAQPVAFDQRLGINVNAKDLDIAKLMASLGREAPANGALSMNLLMAGTVLKPIVHLKVAGRNLKSPAAAKFDAAELDVVAHYSEKELTLDAGVRQKDIQPLVIKGKVPIDVEAVVQSQKLDPDLPIDLTVNLPPTSLAFVPKVVAAVRSIAGTASINAHVTGTVGKPVLSGGTDVKIEYARMNSGGIPNIGAFQLSLGYTENAVNIQKIHGDLGGGTFDITGKILLPKLTEPAFDLHIKSDEVLVKRDESVTVRVDTDIAVSGPLAGGAVKGTVWVTHSRFFKDIDILPIALPGRPKPAPSPKSVPTQASISLGPPLDKWTFDIAVKTRNDDPFLVRGNLANGGAAVDLKFGGTGAEPFLEGNVRIENLVATLPFSKLNITRGFVTFSKDEMLQPSLDITAESDIREYHINIAIYGKASDPQLAITSEPPLAQQDLLSLLATGTTLSELTGNSDVLAGRAASLLFQQLYHKIFKKKGNTDNVPVLNRFEVEVGAVDNRTGRQAVGGSFKINDNLYLLGNLNVAGEFVGRVRYLLRFR